MTSVTLTKTDTLVRVASPYLPDFVAAAKMLGGKWSAPHWVFDVRDEARVRELCIEHYGTDGSPASGPMVTLRIKLQGGAYEGQDALRLGGRDIARAYGRDSGAKIGAGVVVLSGGFSSGGSVKNWCTQVNRTGAEILLRDVPAAMAERLMAEREAWVESITIEPEAPVIDRDALTAERARLVARIAEIDALVGA